MKSFFVIGLLVGLLGWMQPAAADGKLFPPSNASHCIAGTVLTWDGGNVVCLPILDGITVACPDGQVLIGFEGSSNDPKNNKTSCATLPTCGTSQYLTFSNGQFTCQGLNIPTCPSNNTLEYANGQFSCKPFALPVCTAGQFLTSNDGATFTCSTANVCTPNWTTTGTSSCSATCGGGTQIVNQSDGCGHTQTLQQSCNTQSCVVPGLMVYNTPGTYSFTIPAYTTITIEVWGAGGGGGADSQGAAGGQSSFAGTILANGGGAGGSAQYFGGNQTGGAGGSASGGSTNTSGSAGGNGTSLGTCGRGGCTGNGNGGNGGQSPAGGAGGLGGKGTGRGIGSFISNATDGGLPGGGGGGGAGQWSGGAGGGGGGGYSIATYSAGQLPVGTPFTVIVGAGGAGGQDQSRSWPGGVGGSGQVKITWN